MSNPHDGSSSPMGFQVQTFIENQDPLNPEIHPGFFGLMEPTGSGDDAEEVEEGPSLTELQKYVRSTKKKTHGWADLVDLPREQFAFSTLEEDLGPCPAVKALFDKDASINPNLPPPQDPLVILEHMFDDRVVRFICYKCNSSELGPGKKKRRGRQKDDRAPIDPPEFWRWLAILLLLGIHGKSDINHNWSRNWLLETPAFSTIMPVDRFLEILTHLQLSDKEEPQTNGSVKDLLDIINSNLGNLYNVDKDLCLSDSLNMVERFHSYLHYLPGRVNPPFKMTCVSESKSGFISRIMVEDDLKNPYYEIDEHKELLASGQQAMYLFKAYLHKGHTVACDTNFVDPLLFHTLVDSHVDCIGLVKSKQKDLASRELSEYVMQKTWSRNEYGQCVKQYKGKLCLFNFGAPEPIKVLSSFGETDLEENLPGALRTYYNMTKHCNEPDYNKPERPLARRRLKNTHTKILLHILDIFLMNTFVILTSNYQTNPNQFYPQFLLTLVEKIMRKHPVQKAPLRISSIDTPARLVERHVRIIKSSARGRCRVCYAAGNRSKFTQIRCPACKVFVCSVPCYGIYHTENDYIDARQKLWLKYPKAGSKKSLASKDPSGTSKASLKRKNAPEPINRPDPKVVAAAQARHARTPSQKFIQVLDLTGCDPPQNPTIETIENNEDLGDDDQPQLAYSSQSGNHSLAGSSDEENLTAIQEEDKIKMDTKIKGVATKTKNISSFKDLSKSVAKKITPVDAINFNQNSGPPQVESQQISQAQNEGESQEQNANLSQLQISSYNQQFPAFQPQEGSISSIQLQDQIVSQVQVTSLSDPQPDDFPASDPQVQEVPVAQPQLQNALTSQLEMQYATAPQSQGIPAFQPSVLPASTTQLQAQAFPYIPPHEHFISATQAQLQTSFTSFTPQIEDISITQPIPQLPAQSQTQFQNDLQHQDQSNLGVQVPTNVGLFDQILPQTYPDIDDQF